MANGTFIASLPEQNLQGTHSKPVCNWLTRGRGSKGMIVDHHKGPGEEDGEIEVMANIYLKSLPLGPRRIGRL